MHDLLALNDECARLAATLVADGSVRAVDVGFDTSLSSDVFARTSVAVRVQRRRWPDHQRDAAPVSGAGTAGRATQVRDAARGQLTRYDRQPLSARRERVRPPVPGISTARLGNGRRGTLGLLVRRRHDPAETAYGLSCAHVLREVSADPTGTVTQPASDTRDDRVGEFAAAIDDAHGDAAIFRITAAGVVQRAPQFDTGATLTTVDFVSLGARVWKSGVATGVTTGIVDGIGFYRLSDAGHFMRGFRIRALDGDPRPLSAAEDSGAVWFLDDQRTAVGLHTGFDTVNGRRVAIAAHLPLVMTALDVDLL